MVTRWEAIRTAARRARERLAQRLGQPLAALPACINSRQLANKVYRLSATRDGALPANVHAVLDPRGRLIRVRRDASPEEERFYILHELGHAELEGLGDVIVDRPNHINTDVIAAGNQEKGVLRPYNTRERREQEANLFALEVQIPADDLWQQLADPATSIDTLAARYGAERAAVLSQIVNVLLTPPLPKRSLQTGPQRRDGHALHARQEAAIRGALPMLVVAGPGTGKTFSLVERYRALLQENVRPEHILVLTFNNKAAEELRARLVGAFPDAPPVGAVHIYTFHAFGLELLRLAFRQAGLPPGFQMITPGEAYILLKRRLDRLPLTQFKMLKRPTRWLDDLMDAVSRAKDELVTAEAYAAAVEGEVAELRARIIPLAQGAKAKERAEADRLQVRIQRLREVAAFYAAYQEMLRELNAVDYGDLVMLPALLIERDPEVAALFRDMYRVILVDEVQDINYASGELVRRLDGGRQRVWAVGDICQSIYGFRGASPFHLETFQERYPATTHIQLDRNFRSVPGVVRAGDAQITGVRGADRRLRLHATRRGRPAERPVEEFELADGDTELRQIVRILRASVGGRPVRRGGRARSGGITGRAGRPYGTVGRRRWGSCHRRSYGDHAILCNTNEQATAVATTLRQHHIPVEHEGNLFGRALSKDLLALCTLWRNGDMSGLLRVLTTPDYAMSQADIDYLQVEGVAAVGGVRHVLARADEIPGLSEAGRACLHRLHHDLHELNRARTPWQLLTMYLFTISPWFRVLLGRAVAGNVGDQRALQQIGQVLAVARAFSRPTAIFPETTPPGFERYLKELLESRHNDLSTDTLSDPAAVRVMTMHRSKGLEFPVVIMPFLAEGQFPRGEMPPSRVPKFERILHGAPLTRLDEHRYLCYVAMSRARDRLVMLHAGRYDDEEAARTPVLPAQAPWRSRKARPTNEGAPARAGATEGRLAPTVEFQPPVAARVIDTYLTCPRKYLYQEVYRVRTPRDAYGRMRACIDEAERQLRASPLEQGEVFTPEQIGEVLNQVWQERGPVDLPYSDEYRELARQQLTVVAAEIARGQGAEGAVEPLRLDLEHGQVTVQLDGVEEGDDRPTYILAHRGEYDEKHRTRVRTVLAVWHYQQQFPGEKPRVELAYPFAGDQRKLVVYQKGTLEKHLTLINGALAGIAARQFPARPERFKCASCPFVTICPV